MCNTSQLPRLPLTRRARQTNGKGRFIRQSYDWFRMTALAPLLASAIMLSPAALAQSTWTGGGADSSWTTADNWGGVAPTPSTTTDIVFAGSTRTTNHNDFAANSNFRAITFNSAAGAFNLGGSTLNLRGNITFNANPSSPITQTINLGLQLTGGPRLIVGRANGSIQVDGVISDDGTARNLQIGEPGISGRVYLNGDNTFTGQLVGFGGTAVISSLANNGSPSPAGTSNMRLGNGVTSGNIEYAGGAVSVDKGLQVGFGVQATHTAAGWFRNNGSGKLTFTRQPFNPPHGTSIANRTLELGGSADIEIQGEIRDNAASANVAIRKTGANTLTLSGVNTYTGATTIEGGILALSGGGSLGSTPSITIASGAVLDVSGVSFSLGGAQTLLGSGTVSGNLSDAPGSQLVPGGAGGVGILTFNNNLSLGGGGLLGFDLASGSAGDKIVVLGNLDVSGTTTIEVGNFPVPGTTNTILEVTGSLGGSPANFNVSPATGYTVAYDTTGPVKKINLVRAAAPPLVWQGDGSWNQWDVGSTANWTNAPGSPATFQNGDGVVFNDTGSDTPPIYISGDVLPAGVLVSNNVRDYTFWGAGKITGGTSLTKAGSGMLTVINQNDYSGGTTIGAGTLRVGDGSANGVIPGNIVNQGTLVFEPASAVTMAGSISGSGQVIKDGASTLILTGNNTWSGGTVVNGGRLQIGANGTAGSIVGNIANHAELWFNRSDDLTYGGSISGSGGVTVAGGGSGSTTFTGAHSYTSVTTNRGILVLANTTGVCLPGDVYIHGIAGAPVEQVKLGAAEQIPNTAVVTLGGNAACRLALQGFNETIGGLVSSATSGNSIVEAASDGIADKPAVLTIHVALGQSHSYAGALGAITWMRDAAGLNPEAPNSSPLTVVKAGPGTQIIGGGEENISFSGGLLITGGTLQLNNCTAINSVITNNASLIMDITDTRTRFNAITGTGTLTKQGFGTLIVAGANTYSGSTTISEGVLQLDLPALHDSAAVYLTGSGALNLNFEGTDRVGSFHVNGVDQGEGTFDAISHPGLITGTGALQVGGSTSGTVTSVGVAGGTNLVFNTGGSGSLIVQASTNLADPNGWVNLATNMAPFDFTDTNAVQLYPQRFYRTKTP
jgi:fibronectin-binding autotransporter adhesin